MGISRVTCKSNVNKIYREKKFENFTIFMVYNKRRIGPEPWTIDTDPDPPPSGKMNERLLSMVPWPDGRPDVSGGLYLGA